MLESEQIQWNGVQIASVHISDSEKRVAIPSSLISAALYPNGGSVQVTLAGFNSLPFRINPPLAIVTPSALPDAVVGAIYSQTLVLSGGTAPFQWLGTPPTGLTLSAQGVLSGALPSAGTFTFSGSVRDDAQVVARREFTLSVRSANAPPIAVDDAYAISPANIPIGGQPPERTMLQMPAPGVILNDTDPEGAPLSAVLVSSVRSGTLTFNSDGSFIYVANLGFVGEDSFRYRVSDGSMASASAATVRIRIVSEASCDVLTTLVHTAGDRSFPVKVRAYHQSTSTPLVFMPMHLVDGHVGGPYNARTDAEGIAIFRYNQPDGSDAARHVTVTARGGSASDVAPPPVKVSCRSELTLRVSPFSVPYEVCTLFFGTLGAARERDLFATFRNFRDQALRPAREGRAYADLYYKFRPSLGQIMVSHPHLLWRYRDAIRRYAPIAEALMRGEQVSIDAAQVAELQRLIVALEGYAGAELRQALAELRHDLSDNRFLARFGVRIVEDSSTDRLHAAYRRLPLQFEAAAGNAGYLARGHGYDIHLGPTAVVLILAGDSSPVRMKVVGGSAAPRASPNNELPGRSHYLIGIDPTNWRRDVRHYASVRYQGVYPGIDLVYYGKQRELEYDFVVHPGSSPRSIAVAFEGVDAIEIDKTGDVRLRRKGGELLLRRPNVYQEIAGVRQQVEARYVKKGGNRLAFAVGSYDRDKPLIIDPVFSYASYLGANGLEAGMSIAVDSGGNAYVTGATTSTSAVRSPWQGQFAGGGDFGSDAFVTKFDPTGARLIYSTYLGGTNDDIGMGVAVDGRRNAFVTGATRSTNFPVEQPFQRAFAGGGQVFKTDAFVLKLDPAGSRLIYSTYLGGAGDDGARGIAVDADGNAYVAGGTSSRNFPVVGALQNALAGGDRFGSDAFVAKLNPAGSSLLYSTYLGGQGDDAAAAIALDLSGAAYLTGVTYSANFPVRNALQARSGGSADAFLSKLSPNGSTLTYSTYLGGFSDEFGMGVAVNPQGEAHVTGFTASRTDFPLFRAAQPRFGGGGSDAFVSRFNASGSALIHSTFLGGAGAEFAHGIALDAQGNAYIAGDTDSPDFATASALQPALGGKQDGFLAKLNADGSAFEYRSNLGGSEDDSAVGVAVDAVGNVFVAGSSGSPDSPATIGSFQSSLQGQADAWILKIGPAAAQPTITSVSAASSSTATGVAPDSIASGFGSGFATGISVADGQPLPISLNGLAVNVKDSAGIERAAPLIFVSPGQINYVVPTGTQSGLAAVTVLRDGQTVATGTVRMSPVAPALFSANATGRGLAAATLLRVDAEGSQSSEIVGQTISLGGEGELVYLSLYGTGIRHLQTGAKVTIGGVETAVLGAGPQPEYAGLDQINVGPLPRSLIGKGEVEILLTVDGKEGNVVTVHVQ